MPHASPRLDADLAASITERLITSAAVVSFSYAAQREETETRPSRIVAQRAGSPRPLPAQFAPPSSPNILAIPFDDVTHVPYPLAEAPGGASVLTAQSQCAFRAFATARLGAKPWDPAEFGLSALQRGNLLHHVMHSIWSGPPEGFRSRADLHACPDIRSFVAAHVDRAIQTKVPDEIKHRLPPQYLALEATRLSRLITEWLELESARHPFTVAQTESECTVEIAGLSLDLRLDRMDELNDSSLLVIDYKTGYVNPRDWDLPRPDDIQLPLYACFGCDERAGGLVFGRIRAGQSEFAGRMQDATGALLSDLARGSAMVKRPLTSEQLAAWRTHIEQLARDFLAGRADLDPRDYPRTCDSCGLHAVCRIHENWIEPEPEEEEEPPYD